MSQDKFEEYKKSLPDYVRNEAEFDLYKQRHSAEHILTQAMQSLYGKDKIIMAVGPAIEDGFYFDFDTPDDFKITDKDFKKIDKQIKKIIAQNQKFIKKEISAKEAKELFKDNKYKLELINELEEKGEKLTIYENVDGNGNIKFVDLCRGPHVDSTKEVGAVALTAMAGAYWRGNEKNKMLTRIYGTAFPSEKILTNELEKRKRAQENNHRKLGKKLKLFANISDIGQGLPVWLPDGYAMRRVLEEYMLKLERKFDYVHVLTPHINKKELFETSGHLGFYDESMYSPIEVDDEVYYLKPMNCPAGMMIYKQEPKSYRDLPLKLGELGTVYRYEQSGELQGLQRVRGFTQNDAHIFCTSDQLEKQFLQVMEMFTIFYRDIGFTNYKYRLSLSDPNNKEKYVGRRSDWEKTEKLMREVLEKNNIEFYEAEGEAAFYGPKIDVQAINVFGKEDSVSTVQVDFNLPERFDLEYTNNEGEKQRPFVVHRALMGSFERFFAFLIEHYEGKFPLWFAPRQLSILPVSEKFADYAYKINKELQDIAETKNIWLRSKVDDSSERLQSRIRESEIMQLPYTLVVGAKEMEDNSVSLRVRGQGDIGTIPVSEFSEKFFAEIESKSINSIFSQKEKTEKV